MPHYLFVKDLKVSRCAGGDLFYAACVITFGMGKGVDKEKREEAKAWFKKGNEALALFPQDSNFKGLCETFFLNAPTLAGERECYKCGKVDKSLKS
jgi:hypothetical protein